MGRVRVIVLRAPGTNCEVETAHAWRLAGAEPQIEHVNRVYEAPAILNRYAIATLPGGFCHGDDIAAGRIMAVDARLFLADALSDFIRAGKLILGICNGLQVLVKAGLLPGGDMRGQPVSMTVNATGRYEDRWVYLKPTSAHCKFLDGGEPMYLPIGHAEGRVVVRDDRALAALRDRGHVALRYVDETGQCGPYPVNPNGSVDDIAALTDDTGQVLGLMPHPDRHTHYTHHPFWNRLPRYRRPDGLRIFKTAVDSLA